MRNGKSHCLSDPKAVVDWRGRVSDVRRLRVDDASAFALLPPSHAQSNVCKYCVNCPEASVRGLCCLVLPYRHLN